MAGRSKLLRLAVGLAVSLGLISLVDGGGFRRYFRLQREIEAIAQRNRRLADENAALKREIEALSSDPESIERAAREVLGFIKPDEVIIKLE